MHDPIMANSFQSVVQIREFHAIQIIYIDVWVDFVGSLQPREIRFVFTVLFNLDPRARSSLSRMTEGEKSSTGHALPIRYENALVF